MYLEKYIGNNVIVNLNDEAREDKMMKMFYNTSSQDKGMIMNKLHGVDGIGIWIDGFKTTTLFVDENLKPLPNGEEVVEDMPYHVLIPWAYIQGVSVIEDPKLDKRVGYKID
ncbi:hypothetical protein [Terribacillus sp. DMT04]|uniref:hypothetical protein n=1 Tax=Terribacillus sp. DMT04 TaxID=2850441 RepID=UPI001C2C3AFB|nr:hypothetical protein [Terribacillus sp. DMT04]QXE02779.1 hypothetical protein KS242_06260 [Terribacillus sp. DMT04]